MKNNKVIVKDLVETFNLRRISGSEESLNRVVHNREVNRPGLELIGFYKFTVKKRLNLFGYKEIAFIEENENENFTERFDFLTSKDTPCIIIARGLECPKLLKEIATKKDFPILVSDKPTNDIEVALTVYMMDKFSPRTYIHGTLVNMFGIGVLIKGASGIGKSEAAMELIRKGHQLVGDDRINIVSMHDKLYGSAPKHLQNLMEVRGIGIIDASKVFGITSVKDESEINLIIEFTEFTNSKSFERFGDQIMFTKILDIDCPYMELPVSSGRNMADLVEVAVKNLRLKLTGENSSLEFIKKYDKLAANGGENHD